MQKPRFQSAEEMQKSAGRYREDRRDAASTYVLRPRLGIKCPGFQMVRKKDLFDYKLESRFVVYGIIYNKSEIMEK